jgi:hypothetical protein
MLIISRNWHRRQATVLKTLVIDALLILTTVSHRTAKTLGRGLRNGRGGKAMRATEKSRKMD